MQDFFEKKSLIFFFLSGTDWHVFRIYWNRQHYAKKAPEYHFGSPVLWLFKAFLTFIVVDFPKPLSKLACRDLSGKPCD